MREGWQDLRELDEPGASKQAWVNLISQLVEFSLLEEQPTEVISNHRDTDFKRLESQIISLQEVIKLRDQEIKRLKDQLENELRPELEEVSLPDFAVTSKKLNDQVAKNVKLFEEFFERKKVTSSIENKTCCKINNKLLGKSPKTARKEKCVQTEELREEKKQHKAADNSEACKKCCDLSSELYDWVQCYKEVCLRNDYLEQKVEELKGQLQSQVQSSKQREVEESKHSEEINCYQSRLYEAFKEVSSKETQIHKLNESIGSLVGQLNCAEDQLKDLSEEKFRLEETIKQQKKLIAHLQALVESKTRSHH